VTPWTVWDYKAGWALGKPFRYRWCPTPSNGTVKIDVPTLATEKEFAPDSVVVGYAVPCTRDALTGDHGRKIEEAEEIDGDLRRKVGQEVCGNKSVLVFRNYARRERMEPRTDQFPRRLYRIITFYVACLVDELSLLPIKGLKVGVADVGG
jgi:hypothetical protein